MEVSGLYPWKGLSSHLINMAMICPITANMPTTTFHPRRYFGPGLNFEMTWPDIRKPRHIARMAAGPVVEKVGTYISISDVQGGQIRTILSRKKLKFKKQHIEVHNKIEKLYNHGGNFH